MFSKTYYERQFRPHEQGYTIQTMRGLKYVTPEQKDNLVRVYKDSVAIGKSIKRASFAVLLMVLGMIPPIAVIAYFDLDRLFVEAVTWLAIVILIVGLLIPHFKFYRLHWSTLRSSRKIEDRRTKQEKRADNIVLIPWWSILAGFPLGVVICYAAVEDGVQNWVEGSVLLFGLLLIARMIQVAIMKIRHESLR